jgi:hypothetical protein
VYAIDVACPRCGALVDMVVAIGAVLTIPDDDMPTIKLRCKSLKVGHACGQGSLFDFDAT